MANISSFIVDGVSYAYDTESKNPLSLGSIKKLFETEQSEKIVFYHYYTNSGYNAGFEFYLSINGDFARIGDVVEEDGKLIAYTVPMYDGTNGLAGDLVSGEIGDEAIEISYGGRRIGQLALVETIYLDELKPKTV